MGWGCCALYAGPCNTAARASKDYLIIELPDGCHEQIAHAWTEDLIDGGSAVPALLFSPSSLRKRSDGATFPLLC